MALRKPVSSALKLVRAIYVMLESGSFFPSSRAIKRTTARYKFTVTAQCHPHILPKNNTSTSTAAPKAANRIRNGCLSLGSSVLFWSLKPPLGSSAASSIFPSVPMLSSIMSFLKPRLLMAALWVRQHAAMISPEKLLSLSIPIHVCKNLAENSHPKGDGRCQSPDRIFAVGKTQNGWSLSFLPVRILRQSFV